MKRHSWVAAACAAAALALACDSPTGPGPLERPIGGRGPGNETLKSVAPVPVAPRNNAVVDSVTPTLIVNNSRMFYTFLIAPMLVFEVLDDQGSLAYRSLPVVQQPGITTQHVVETALSPRRTYTWEAFPVLEGRQGLRSARATFRTP